jgi:hypothetical protein
MNSKAFSRVVRFIAVLVLAVGTSAQAQAPTPKHLSGVINDYTPISGTTAWEVRGPWTLKLKGESGLADFSAAVTMELSVLGQSTTTVSAVALTQHTHHITMNDATVTSFETIEASGCPSFSPATSGPVLVVSGQATVTANGQTDTPFAPQGQSSQLTLCLSGGTGVPYANITLQLGSPASKHFGSQAIHGVVRIPHKSDEGDGDKH